METKGHLCNYPTVSRIGPATSVTPTRGIGRSAPIVTDNNLQGPAPPIKKECRQNLLPFPELPWEESLQPPPPRRRGTLSTKAPRSARFALLGRGMLADRTDRRVVGGAFLVFGVPSPNRLSRFKPMASL